MVTPILENERLILRPLTVNDAEHVFNSWTSDPEVAKYMLWKVHRSVEDTITWLRMEEEALENDNHYVWGFVLKETGDLFGSGGIHFKEEIGCFELGYNIMKKYWGQGLTTEASRLILDFAIHTLGETKFFCRHAIENIGSMMVMQKLGFQYFCESSYDNDEKHFLSKDYYLNIE